MKIPALSTSLVAHASRTACVLGVCLFLAGVAPASAQNEQADASFIHGLTVGGGLAFYEGDLDTNPENNYLKFLGSSRPSFFVRADRRSGRYTLGLELNYNRLGGERQFSDRTPLSFSNNLIGLDAVGSIDFGFPEPDMIRLFAGLGPTLFASPEYGGFQAFSEESGSQEDVEVRDLGTRVRPDFMLGFSVQDAVRIGAKVFPTDFVDGFNGFYFPVDFLVFVNIGYRFDLTD